jgi:hypothetical protein
MKRKSLVPTFLVALNLMAILYFIASTERMPIEAIEKGRPHFEGTGVSFQVNSAIGIIIFGHNLSMHWASPLERLIILPNTVPYLMVAILGGPINMLPLPTIQVTYLTGLLFLLGTSAQWLIVGMLINLLAQKTFKKIA